MPNGGITPDCVHCKYFSGKPISEGESFCKNHNINLPVPIRAFCKNYMDRETDGDKDWLDMELNRDDLQDNTVYVWLGGYETKFYYVELASINSYATMTREEFFEHYRILEDQNSTSE